MRRWLALTTVSALAILATVGLWTDQHAVTEQAQVSLSAQARAEALVQQAFDGPAMRRDARDGAQALSAQVLQHYFDQGGANRILDLSEPDPVLRPGTVVPALAMVGAALLAVRWLERRGQE